MACPRNNSSTNSALAGAWTRTMNPCIYETHICARCAPARRYSDGRGFSLIELLVIISIIALLVGILLPALAKTRTAAQRAVSAANLAQWARVQATYASEFRDSFVNPFDRRMSELYPGTQLEWYSVPMSRDSQTGGSLHTLDFGEAPRTTEGFSLGWGWYMVNYLSDSWDSGSSCLRDPADVAINQRAARLKESLTNVKASIGTAGTVPFDTSYWYSPVFWLGAERYSGEAFQPINSTPASAGTDVKWLRRYRFDDALYGAQKVMLFERFDWSTKRKPSGTAAGMIDGAAQWNNPGAKPQVAFVDASVCIVKMSDIHALGESDDPAITAQLRPSGYWDPSGAYLHFYDVLAPQDTDPFETGVAPFTTTTAWRQYFYATRNGVRGRDVSRR